MQTIIIVYKFKSFPASHTAKPLNKENYKYPFDFLSLPSFRVFVLYSSTQSHTLVFLFSIKSLCFFYLLSTVSNFGSLHKNRVLCSPFIAMKYIRNNSLKRLFSFGRRSSFVEENDENIVAPLPLNEEQQHPSKPSWKCFSYEDLFHATNGFNLGT